jgi:3-deoxy-D-arabino-heptulosonate 7-phosphate (DAHP) synthase class II
MWDRLFGLLKSFFTINEEVKKLQADSKDYAQQIRCLADNQARLYYEIQLQRERDAREREREAQQHDLAAFERERQMSDANAQCLSAIWNYSGAKTGCYVKS